jgi:hypothetical protein
MKASMKARTVLQIACLGLLAVSARAQVVQVVGVSTDEQNLKVKVQWSEAEPLPSSASLVVTSTNGTVRASQPLSPSSGDAEVVLPSILTTQDIGAAFQASVVDAAQEPLSALPFDLVLSCDTPTSCRLRARPGFAAAPGSQVIGKEMDTALASSLSAATRLQPDVLGDVMARNPGLIGETYTYAATVAKTVPLLPINTCFCSWNTVNDPRPPIATEVRNDPDPAHQRGSQGPGAAHSLRAWYDGGLASATHFTETSVEGETETTMKLQCLFISGWRLIVIHLFGRDYYIYFPIIEHGCPGCTGKVDTKVDYYADTSAFVDTGWFGSGEAAAQEEGYFSVNGQNILTRISRVGNQVRKQWGFKLTIPGLGTVQEDNGNFALTGDRTNPNIEAEIKYVVDGSDGTVQKNINNSASKNAVVEPVTALFQSKALAYAKGSSDTDSEGKSTMSYLYAMHGNASCAIPRDAEMWNYFSYNGRTKQLQTSIKTFFSGYNLVVNP